jgi:radical SAM protein with 4Fe4S-binding SPASM domain
MNIATPRSEEDSANVIAVASMLHEPEHRLSSAGRLFRGEPVLTWTLRRIAQCRKLSGAAILCWEDQLPQTAPIAAQFGVHCRAFSARIKLPQMDAVWAARRWADGWRGGLLGSCEFDRGFHGSWIMQILTDLSGQSALLVDPSAGLVDPTLLDGLVDHSASRDEIDFFFSPAAPGLSGVLIRKSMLQRLAAGGLHPGMLLAYRPDVALSDPISSEACAPIPAPLARTIHRFTLDSDRQITRLSTATEHLNGELIGSPAEQLLQSLGRAIPATMPREVVLELTPRRNTRPIYWPGTHLKIDRGDLSAEMLRKILGELAEVDDVRLVLGGVGDPLLHREVFDLISRAAAVGISVALETDLVGVESAVVDWLAESSLDIVSVNFPAITARTYEAVMGIDGMKEALENLRRLIERAQARRSGTPLVVPTFVKTKTNLAEMERWYDHWLRILGCAVISGPSDFSKTIPDVSAARMEPPLRRACARLAGRITILCDGTIVSCEQDVLGKQALGHIARQSIAEVWRKSMTPLREDHERGNWAVRPVCANCSDWHRP